MYLFADKKIRLELLLLKIQNWCLPSIFTIENVTQIVMPCLDNKKRADELQIQHYCQQEVDLVVHQTGLPTYVPVILQLVYPEWEVSESSLSWYLNKSVQKITLQKPQSLSNMNWFSWFYLEVMLDRILTAHQNLV